MGVIFSSLARGAAVSWALLDWDTMICFRPELLSVLRRHWLRWVPESAREESPGAEVSASRTRKICWAAAIWHNIRAGKIMRINKCFILSLIWPVRPFLLKNTPARPKAKETGRALIVLCG